MHDKSMANCSQKAWKESTQPDGFAFGISGCSSALAERLEAQVHRERKQAISQLKMLGP